MADHELPRGPVYAQPITPDSSADEPQPEPRRRPAWVDEADILGAPETNIPPGSIPLQEAPTGIGSDQRRRSRFRLLLIMVALLLVSTATYDAVLFLNAVFASSIFVGGLFVLLFLAVAGTLGWWTYGVIADLKDIAEVNALRERGQSLLESKGPSEIGTDLQDYIGDLSEHYADDAQQRMRLASVASRVEHLATQRTLDGREGVSQVSNALYHDVDDQALKIVVKRAQQAALMTAVSRVALFDLLIVLWRSFSLIFEIATLYGGRPGRIGLMRLARLSLANVVYADVSEIAADMLMQVAGDRALTALSVQAAQGMSIGLMLGRLGLQAIRLCRPVPFTGTETHPPSYKKLYAAMSALIKEALAGYKPGKVSTGASA